MKQVPYCEHTYITCQRTEFSRHGDLETGISDSFIKAKLRVSLWF
jgi:hypothetical protein